MEPNDTKDEKKEKDPDISSEDDVDKLIAERERLETLFQEKFTKRISVMFTDLKGSTAISDIQGDLAGRTLIKQHNSIVLPIIKKWGTLVKTMGDGTMSYFKSAQDAVLAAVEIQSSIDEHNIVKKPNVPLLLRAGIHTGTGIVEKDDIFGDVVNVAARFEQVGSPGEVLISEETYNSMADKTAVYCRFIKMAKLKGKKEEYKVYKVFWKKEEMEADKSGAYTTTEEVKTEGIPLVAKLLILFSIFIVIGFFVLKTTGLLNSVVDKRTIHHVVDVPFEGDRGKLDESTEKPTNEK